MSIELLTLGLASVVATVAIVAIVYRSGFTGEAGTNGLRISIPPTPDGQDSRTAQIAGQTGKDATTSAQQSNSSGRTA